MRVAFGAYELDTDRFELLREGKPVSMEPQTFEVLAYLVRHPERVVSRQELFDAIWGTTYITDSALATRIKEARRAVGDDGQAQRVIRTVHGRGYRFVAELTPNGAPPSAAISAPASSRSVSTSSATDGLAFVGRERELAALHAQLDAACAGNGRLVMISGEPGIGKTRLVQELEPYASERGASMLWGRAQEFEGAPPYWPWVQILRSIHARTDEAALLAAAQPHAVELQRLLPALRALFPDPGPAETDESDDAQFRLFDAMSQFLHAIARQAPTVIVLDDLHWADAASLRMLTHAGREVRGAPILLLGTYRDTDVDRAHPLTRALAELNREPHFARIALDGLDVDAIAAYVRSAAAEPPSSAVLSHIAGETEGNPFLLSEVVKLLRESDALTSRDEPAILEIPMSVAEALGRRLERLSDSSRDLLMHAAIAGREFEVRLLHALSDGSDEQMLRCLDEALAAHLIEEGATAAEYRFTHALMRETLLAELSAPRRAQIHGRIAEALEANGGDAPALAAHYVASAAINRNHAQAAVRYSRRAAEQARSQFAWDDAARHYRNCIDLVSTSGIPDDDEEAGLWLELAIAQLANGRFLRGDAARRAFALWPPDDHPGMARALLRLFALEPAPPMIRFFSTAIDRALQGLGAEPSEEACDLLAWKALAMRGESGDSAAEQATDMAEALGLDVPAALRIRPARVALDEGRLADAAAAFTHLVDDTGDGALTAVSLLHLAYTEWPAGRLDRVDSAVRELLALNHARRTQRGGRNQLAWLAFLEWRRGNLDTAQEHLADVPTDLNLPAIDLLRPELAIAAGDLDQALRSLPDLDSSPWLFFQAERLGARCRVLQLRGEHDAARAAFREWRAAFERVYEPDLLEYLFAIHGLDDAICEFADEALLQAIRLRFDPLTELRNWWLGSGPDYFRGMVALTLDDHSAARSHFQTGLDWAEREGVPFVAGRCHQGLAAVAQRRGRPKDVARHLDAAAEYFTRIGASLYLKQVDAARARIER